MKKRKKLRDLKQIVRDARKTGHTHVSEEEFAYAFHGVQKLADKMQPCPKQFSDIIGKHFWELIA